MAAKKKDLSLVVWVFGWLLSLCVALKKCANQQGVPFDAFERLVSDKGEQTLAKVMLLILADWEAEQPRPAEQIGTPYRSGTSIRKAQFSATVVYVMPAMDELKRRFSSYVNPAYDGIVFEPIKVCKEISRETRGIEFDYVHIGRHISNDAALAEIDKRGFRPALPEELLAFDAKYPEEASKYPIVALGAETDVNGFRYVAFAWLDGDGRYLYLFRVDDDWLVFCRFLVVRK